MFNNSKENMERLIEQYNKFSMLCKERSQLCKYWDGIITSSNMLKNLVSADKEGNWERHLEAVQDLLLIFCESNSINYLRYSSWYLEKMRQLPDEYPETYSQFRDGKFVVKTTNDAFNSVSLDMKLEQTINRTRKSSGGIVGQTKKTLMSLNESQFTMKFWLSVIVTAI